MMARLAWFYGWSIEDIKNLEQDDAHDWYAAITQIEAQQTLLLLKIQDWPDMKKESRSTWHKELHRMAYPATHKELVSTEELARRIQSIIG